MTINFEDAEKELKEIYKKEFPDFKIEISFYQIALWDTRFDIDFDKGIIEIGVYYGAYRDGRLHLKEMINDIREKIELHLQEKEK